MTLREEHEAILVRVLSEYRDIFVWEPKDIPGVDPSVSVHRLYVDLITSRSNKRIGPFPKRSEKPFARRWESCWGQMPS
ncbi:hypothetical protein LIER_06866 [Lithospermum erythrorhizon]|uniref:Uncharacterized protein n=1 Tax=Lithospermum erythrorhizon TaxID=34254 RepID=A0AAV3P653_LITER